MLLLSGKAKQGRAIFGFHTDRAYTHNQLDEEAANVGWSKEFRFGTWQCDDWIDCDDGSDEWMRPMLAESCVTFADGDGDLELPPSPDCTMADMYLCWGDLTNTCEHTEVDGQPIDRELWDHEYDLEPLTVRRAVSIEPITSTEADALLSDPKSGLTSLNLRA